MNAIEISKNLKRMYFIQLVPSAILIGLLCFMENQFKWQGAMPDREHLLSDILVGLTAVVGIAFPIFFRSFFVFKVRDKKEITKDVFLRFEKALMIFSLITPYFLALSIAIDLNNKANIFITILALYAVYYYYPSVRKVKFEMKVFRIKPEPETESES